MLTGVCQMFIDSMNAPGPASARIWWCWMRTPRS
jgi:hypothetical protein